MTEKEELCINALKEMRVLLNIIHTASIERPKAFEMVAAFNMGQLKGICDKTLREVEKSKTPADS